MSLDRRHDNRDEIRAPSSRAAESPSFAKSDRRAPRSGRFLRVRQPGAATSNLLVRLTRLVDIQVQPIPIASRDSGNLLRRTGQIDLRIARSWSERAHADCARRRVGDG